MVNKVKTYIEENNMISKGDKIILGVSGGADSLCLFYVLLELSKQYESELTVVHVDHGLRGEDSANDAAFVKELCQGRGIKCYVFTPDVLAFAKEEGISTEEAGRILRYELFEKVLKEECADKIAVAHNMNDNSETIIMNMARGTGLKGIHGIAPIRDKIIRPLICLTRNEIEQYLCDRGLSFRNDMTNETDDYTRNVIRHRVLPQLIEVNEKAIEHMFSLAEDVADAEEYIEAGIDKLFESCVTKEQDAFAVNICKWEKEYKVLKEGVIRRCIMSLTSSLKDISRTHVESICKLSKAQTGSRVDLPYNLICVREYDNLVIKKKDLSKPIRINQSIVLGVNECPGMTVEVSKALAYPQGDKNLYTKYFDYDKIKNGLTLRNICQDDFISINGDGQKIKLRKYLVNEKVPASKRNSVLVLADGNEIVWVIGYRIGYSYRVTEETKNIIKVSAKGETIHEGNNN